MKKLRFLVAVLWLAGLTACVLDTSGLWGHRNRDTDGGRDGWSDVRHEDLSNIDTAFDRISATDADILTNDAPDGFSENSDRIALDLIDEDTPEDIVDLDRTEDNLLSVDTIDIPIINIDRLEHGRDFLTDSLPDRTSDRLPDMSFDRLPDRRFGDCRPSTEVCNGADDDCDGETDEGLGETTCGVGVCVRVAPNCLDGLPNMCIPGPPALTEDCRTATDDDCDGESNEMDAMYCINFYYDFDGDGYSATERFYQCWCEPSGYYRARRGRYGDCDDNSESVHPGVSETCFNFTDDDCDGYTDEGC